ncbi:MAG: hypothetical protein ACI8TF_003077 [Paracoccaceae bacterium]|jgi:hypothetical protein
MRTAMWIRTLLLLVVTSQAQAQEFIEVPGPVDDATFYRIVACAAQPGLACRKPEIRWPQGLRTALRVGIAQIDVGFASYRLDLVDQALDAAILEINTLGVDLGLERVFEPPFDIPIYLTDAPQGGVVRGTGVPELDGVQIAIGRVAIRSRAGTIQSAAIAISQDIRRREVASIVLEELVQAMGLPTDIRSPAYRDSIFSEEGNSVVWLRGQDAEALRRHYPSQ